ncbi:MAG TPA: HAMP domain-containing histidine kinase [Leptolyngbyaceae cyanobacterium M33_DOE_097]|uniref:histidine kinase n=1 Tax=Oscillatoriales cyanobacterium SpSt-418 TaxID=2282169 RepID=A0A7C3PJF1_9CYAN|nr:HAMP domain-containing histidine kinase [Leptolyngbyaceae cyanobacterium M33_DOE_097]
MRIADDYVTDLLNLIHLYQQQFPQPGAAIEDEIDAMDLEYITLDFPKVLLSIQESANRIREISHSLRIFSRSDCDRPVPFNVHDGLDSTLLILKHRLRADEKRAEIEVVKNYGDLPNIECYAGQLNQVFMNIVANEIEAIDDASAAADANSQLVKPYKIVLQTSLTSDHQHIQIRIQDNGIGMSENVCQKVFDHLFTTKDVGKGTGLGLAIARQVVVQKHQGTLEVRSNPDEGAEFIITLPISNPSTKQNSQNLPIAVSAPV